MIEGLSPEEVRGKIYTGWQIIDVLPQDARLLCFGVDWGWYPDPLSVIALYYYNGSYIVDEVAYGTNILDEDLANSIKKVMGWNMVDAYCGADEPKSIEVLTKYKIRAKKGVSGPGAVAFRIKTTSEKKMFVTKRSVHIWESYENYHWAEDNDGNPKGEPDHYLSDCMDAVGYAVASINPMNKYILPQSQKQRQKTNIAV